MGKEIPERQDPGWYEAREFIESKFVEVESNEYLEVALQYPLMGMINAVSNCLVRSEGYEMLIEAGKLLPTGYKLKIWDAWRPLKLQEELYEVYSKLIMEEFYPGYH